MFPPHKHMLSWRCIYMHLPLPQRLQTKYVDFGLYVPVIPISTNICANDCTLFLLVNSPSRLQTPLRRSLVKCGTNSSGTCVEGAARWTRRCASHPTRPRLRLKRPLDGMISAHCCCLVQGTCQRHCCFPLCRCPEHAVEPAHHKMAHCPPSPPSSPAHYTAHG